MVLQNRSPVEFLFGVCGGVRLCSMPSLALISATFLQQNSPPLSVLQILCARPFWFLNHRTISSYRWYHSSLVCRKTRVVNLVFLSIAEPTVVALPVPSQGILFRSEIKTSSSFFGWVSLVCVFFMLALCDLLLMQPWHGCSVWLPTCGYCFLSACSFRW